MQNAGVMQSRKISVTELSRIMGRQGDLGRRHFSLIRGVEGIRVHQRMQKDRGEGYRAEVSVKTTWALEGEQVEIFGRMDGLALEGEGYVIEEFKTSRDYTERLPLDHGMHVLQAELYAWIWWKSEGVIPKVRLEYVNPDPHQPTRKIEWVPESLDQRMEEICTRWMSLCLAQEAWISDRNQRLQALQFPFAEMRPGQEQLVASVKETFTTKGQLFVQAPTGIGKTMGVLLPALQALGEGEYQTLVVATCRNTGKRIFEEAFGHLFPAEAGLRVLTLLARDRVCTQVGSPCTCEDCPLAKGFYDRLPEGLIELRQQKFWNAETWQAVAARHQLCPFAFMMHAAREADVIIGDLNYALDPSARLEFLFGERPETVGLLIDEAHHLPERSRAMISANLDLRKFQEQLKKLTPEMRQLLHKDLQRVLREVRTYQKLYLTEEGLPKPGADSPDQIARACTRALEALDESFADGVRQGDDPRNDLYQMLNEFRQSTQQVQPSHVCTREGTVFCHLCLDASAWLMKRWDSLSAVVIFSGTLLPLDVFLKQSGALERATQLELQSPYNSHFFKVALEEEIPLVWKARGPELYERLAQRIMAELTAHAVKTLVFFPSYALMDEVAARLPKDDIWLGPILVQPRGLQEEAADAFLKPFRESQGPVTGLAVLGGALNEGIDLPGEALESVIVVSIGLPGISRERELMRKWYEDQGEEGFVMAYTLPGLVRVLQAMGRVIRGPRDRGTGLLIDPRFRHPLYQKYIEFR
ncbi:helicase C-terminal domain-containing protein [Kiritimatiellota bacterium B12222]|nr:helicase C-terminal domain-containing protein [Kiritimatiellota bacterium B12222]